MKKKNHNSKKNKSPTFSDKLKLLAATSETEPEKTLQQVKVLLEEHPANAILLTIAGNAARNCNMTEKALDYIDCALELEPDALFALRVKAGIEIDNENHKNALPFLEKAIELYPEDSNILFLLMFSLLKLKHYDELFQLFKKIEQVEIIKINSNHLNVYGNALLETAKIQEAIAAFQKSLELEPLNNSSHANLIFAQHYSLTHTAEQILNECKRFQERFRSLLPVKRAVATNRSPGKKIRIGMISDGFRGHPVGSMITYGLAHVPREQIEFIAYSTNNKSDHVTEKIKKICTKWEVVEKLSDLELDQLIRNDKIDILFDLAGFNTNTRTKTIMQEPAPIIIKWVGGLISSTGLDAVNYLLSDRVETPLGADDLYTEKLIRLPDDYICFKPHFYTPPVGDLPVLRNGYITFACFNNASKINDQLLQQWANILNSVPNSRLFLKSQGYASTDLCKKIYGFFAKQGISHERIRLEQASPHKELLERYNEVDIALDPWPYSGGLTTCEALIMGVPVITLPGPTFAGRHSATHLVNAGMPELVADDWDHYHQLAVSLANDLDNLNTIRQNLRFIVLQSPLCDGERFSRSFSNAMRAVWQRYCEGKVPEALVLSDEQVPYFADEEGPVELMHPGSVENNIEVHKSEIVQSDQEEDFRFDFTGRIVTVDNGTGLVKRNYFPKLIDFGAFSFILFDPAGEEDKQQFPIDQSGSIQHFPFHALGNGKKTNLYVCVDASQSSTLVPINKNLLKTGEKPDPTTVVAEIPVFTVKADGIAGLTHIDWLLLSGRYEVLSLLNQDNHLTGNALVIQVNLPADVRYQDQPGIDLLKNHLAELGYILLRIDGNKYQDYLGGVDGLKDGMKSSHMSEYSLLFVLNQEKIKQLTSNQREKLAFILHNSYGIHDFTYYVLAHDNAVRARVYLEMLGLCKKNLIDENVNNINQLVSLVKRMPISPGVPHTLPGKLVVSLTSYKRRFSVLPLTLRCLLKQSVRPDHLILWIAYADKEFLTKDILDLQFYGLEIKFCEDIRSYKKIIPTLRDYSDAFIVTADDDLFYDKDWLKKLISNWDGNEKTIVAWRAHQILLNDKNLPTSYKNWGWNSVSTTESSDLLFPTSGAGTLYPPFSFHTDVINVNKFLKLAPDADDVWLYWMHHINGSKCKVVGENFPLITWPGSQEEALFLKNLHQGENDVIIKKMIDSYGFFTSKTVDFEVDHKYNHVIKHNMVEIIFHLPNIEDHIQKIIKNSGNFYEIDMLQDIAKRTPKGSSIIDVGANIGNHSIYFGMFCDAGKVISFEPQPFVFDILSKNIKLNDLENKVRVFQLGIGSEQGHANLQVVDSKNLGMTKLSSDSKGKVEIVTLDDFFENNFEIDNVSVLKIDVEGMEIEVLKGAIKTIIKYKPFIYAEAGDHESYVKLDEFLSSYGYIKIDRFNATATYLFAPAE